ncbi:MAG: glycoside hydrolase family 95 protein [Bacteroidaceae bacterium]|nr:glycoside hydrolase family 95 protein [Bacteroidaceae bacterium]
MFKRLHSLFIVLFTVTLSLTANNNADTAPKDFKVSGADSFTPKNALTLWYDTPATLTDAGYKWMEYSLPIGNGRLGACLLGGVAEDEIQFNEKTLWEGSPNDMGNYGGYKNFGWIKARDISGAIGYEDYNAATDYVRYLDIEEAIAGVKYYSGGTVYSREYFASAPDNVIAIRYTADGGKLSMQFALIPGKGINASTVQYTDGNATFGGKLTTVSYNARLRVLPSGSNATMTADANGITVKNADEIVLLLAAGTDYDSSSPTFTSGTSTLAKQIQKTVDEAAAKGYTTLRNNHTKEFTGYMSRVKLNFDGAASHVNTKQLIDNYNDKNKNVTGIEPETLFLEQLYFAYGRYLLISSSRGINVPNNLQGIWNDQANAPWNSDIHSNINIQMNYWPAEPTNLSELHNPFLHYIITMANGDNWKRAAKRGGQTKGWTCFTENNIFGGMSTWGDNYFVANVWYCSHLWQHYRYTLDKEFLAKAFPVMWSCAEFWFERMIPDRVAKDGTYVCPDEYSAEQNDHPKEDATAHAQQMVYTHLLSVKEAIDILGRKACGLSKQQVAQLDEYLAKTDQGLHTETFKGESWEAWGAQNDIHPGDTLLREWKYASYDVSNDKAHRHMSHLMCLYPLNQITPESKYFIPAVNALKLRGDEATGWSMGWKVNLWARALDGNHAHRIIRNALKHSTSYGVNQYAGGIYYNLWDSHAPFQIDGNFGVCAGISEMLMQSQSGTIHLLPALPAVWKNGSISGLKAVGDFTVSITWKNGKAAKAEIINNKGSRLKVRYPGLDNATVTVAGKKKSIKKCGNDTYTIPSKKGDKIIMEF